MFSNKPSRLNLLRQQYSQNHPVRPTPSVLSMVQTTRSEFQTPRQITSSGKCVTRTVVCEPPPTSAVPAPVPRSLCPCTGTSVNVKESLLATTNRARQTRFLPQQSDARVNNYEDTIKQSPKFSTGPPIYVENIPIEVPEVIPSSYLNRGQRRQQPPIHVQRSVRPLSRRPQQAIPRSSLNRGQTRQLPPQYVPVDSGYVQTVQSSAFNRNRISIQEPQHVLSSSSISVTSQSSKLEVPSGTVISRARTIGSTTSATSQEAPSTISSQPVCPAGGPCGASGSTKTKQFSGPAGGRPTFAHTVTTAPTKNVKIRVRKTVPEIVPMTMPVESEPPLGYYVMPQRLATGRAAKDAVYSSPQNLRKRIDSNLNIKMRQWQNKAVAESLATTEFREQQEDMLSGSVWQNSEYVLETHTLPMQQTIPDELNQKFTAEDYIRYIESQRLLADLEYEEGIDSSFEQMRLQEQDYDLWYAIYQYQVDPEGAYLAVERIARRYQLKLARLPMRQLFSPGRPSLGATPRLTPPRQKPRRLAKPPRRLVQYIDEQPEKFANALPERPPTPKKSKRPPKHSLKYLTEIMENLSDVSFGSDLPSFGPDVSVTSVYSPSPIKRPEEVVEQTIEDFLAPTTITSNPDIKLTTRPEIRSSSSLAVSSQGERLLTMTTSLVEKPPSPAVIKQLVEEELNDFERSLRMAPMPIKSRSPNSYGLKKRINEMRAQTLSLSIIEESVPLPTADDEVADMQPEIAAAIMHTEERGIEMDGTPAHLYSYLFAAGNENDPLMAISSIAPPPLQDVVVPMTVPQSIHKTILSDELKRAAMTAQTTVEQPYDSVFSDIQNHGQLQNTAAEGVVRTAADGSISELVGADATKTSRPVFDTSALLTDTGIEVLLRAEPPLHQSKVQLRGTQNPSWFPGYYVVLPDSPEVRIARSPSAVLIDAWRASHPETFAEQSRIVVT